MSQIVVEDLTAESVAPVTSAEPETTAPKREVSEAAKAALKEYQEASKKAKAFLAEVILGKHPPLVLPNEVLEAIRVLVPIRNAKQGHATPRNAKQQVLDKLLDLFMANDGKVTLMQVFKEFRMGEGEMRVRMRNAIHDRKPEERMWITYDSEYRDLHLGRGWREPARRMDWHSSQEQVNLLSDPTYLPRSPMCACMGLFLYVKT